MAWVFASSRAGATLTNSSVRFMAGNLNVSQAGVGLLADIGRRKDAPVRR